MKTDKRILCIVLIVQLIIGVLLFRDFPITWDEETSRLGTGRSNVEFILGNDQDSLLMNHEKYHGPAFEILLYAFEKTFSLKDEKIIYQTRHLLSHLVFIAFGFFFFRYVLYSTKNKLISIFALLILYTSPRIFADSFNNSKDLVYFSFYGLAIISGINWIGKRDLKSLLLHALLCGFLLSIRLTGLVLIPISMMAFAIGENGFLLKKYFKPLHLKRQFLFLAISFLVCILFWPVLWDGPVYHLTEAWKEMKQFGWGGEVLFRGKYFYASQLPMVYPIRWMMISIPLPYLILSIIGIFIAVFQLKNLSKQVSELFILLCFAIPFFTIIFMKPVLYDGWRHLYFLYAPMIFFIIKAIQFILDNLESKKKNLKIAFIIVLSLCIGWMFYWMINLHPLQNIYFNRLAGKNLSRARLYYDVDYWGTSVKECLDYIVENDDSDTLTILYDYDPVYLNAKLLSKRDQQRIVFKNREDFPEYRINLYRFRPEKYLNYIPIYHVMRDGGIVSTVYKKGR